MITRKVCIDTSAVSNDEKADYVELLREVAMGLFTLQHMPEVEHFSRPPYGNSDRDVVCILLTDDVIQNKFTFEDIKQEIHRSARYFRNRYAEMDEFLKVAEIFEK